ncbi:MAG TPA: hypothetical protein VH678_22145 [Xanthobacteraceae bacterium]|jgi:hypothetical protein
MKTPAEMCDAMQICTVVAHALPWDEIAAIVAALAFIYGLAMAIAFFLYVYRSRSERRARSTQTRA